MSTCNEWFYDLLFIILEAKSSLSSLTEVTNVYVRLSYLVKLFASKIINSRL